MKTAAVHLSACNRVRRLAVVGVSLMVLSARITAAAPGPPPPPPAQDEGPPPPPEYYPPPQPPRYYPPPVIQPAPPPLSPAMRVIYAPFYAAGLVLRYGLYYVVIAPFEVFGRAFGYGVEGGVDSGDYGGK